MYSLLKGKPPMSGLTIDGAFDKVKNFEIPRIDKVVADVPEPIGDLIEHLLKKDPEQRIQTALALTNRIEALEQELKSYSEAKTYIVPESDSKDTDFSTGESSPGPVSSATRISKPLVGKQATAMSQQDSSNNATMDSADSESSAEAVMRQPDYFSPVTEQVRKKVHDEEELSLIHISEPTRPY